MRQGEGTVGPQGREVEGDYSHCRDVSCPFPRPFETFAHDADIGVRGRGTTLAETLANAGRALTAVVTEPTSVREVLSVQIACEASDPEVLLFDWLNALVFEMATRRVLFARYEVGWRRNPHARAFGEPVRWPSTTRRSGEKATWSSLRVARERSLGRKVRRGRVRESGSPS
jgi:SHS2 domain-containing protein